MMTCGTARFTAADKRCPPRLAKAGADLATLNEPLDTMSAARRMVFRLLAVLNEFERDLGAERVRLNSSPNQTPAHTGVVKRVDKIRMPEVGPVSLLRRLQERYPPWRRCNPFGGGGCFTASACRAVR